MPSWTVRDSSDCRDGGWGEAKSQSLLGSRCVEVRGDDQGAQGKSRRDEARAIYLRKKETQIGMHLVQTVSHIRDLLSKLEPCLDSLPSGTTESFLVDVHTVADLLHQAARFIRLVSSSLSEDTGRGRGGGILELVDLPTFEIKYIKGKEGKEGIMDEATRKLRTAWLVRAQAFMTAMIKVLEESAEEISDALLDAWEEDQQQDDDLVHDDSASAKAARESRFARTVDYEACLNLAFATDKLQCIMHTIEPSMSNTGALMAVGTPGVPPPPTMHVPAWISARWALGDDHPISILSSVFDASVDSFETMKAVVQYLTPVVYGTRSTIIKKGTVGMQMYFVRSGSTSVVLDGKALATRQKGEFFGELALTTNTQRKADVVASQDDVVEVLELTRESFNNMCERFPMMLNRIEEVGKQRAARHGWDHKRRESGAARRCHWKAAGDEEPTSGSFGICRRASSHCSADTVDAASPHGASDEDAAPPPKEWGCAFATAGWGEACNVQSDDDCMETLGGYVAEAVLDMVEEQVEGVEGETWDEIMQAICASFRRQTFKRGDILAQHGQDGGTLWVLDEGKIARKRRGSSRGMEDEVLQVHGKGTVMGAVVSFVAGAWPHEMVVQSEEASVLVLNPDDLLDLLVNVKHMERVLKSAGTQQWETQSWHTDTVRTLDLGGRDSKRGSLTIRRNSLCMDKRASWDGKVGTNPALLKLVQRDINSRRGSSSSMEGASGLSSPRHSFEKALAARRLSQIGFGDEGGAVLPQFKPVGMAVW